MSAVGNALLMSVACVSVFNVTRARFTTGWVPYLCAINFIFIPMAAYASVATLADLHFFLLAALLPVVVGPEEARNQPLPIILTVATCLSLPLTLFLVPISGLRLMRYWVVRTEPLKVVRLDLALVGGTACELLYAFGFGSGANRLTHGAPWLKTVYMFFDRVVGSTFVPLWGQVSQADLTVTGASILGFPPHLFLRLAIAFAVFVAWLALMNHARRTRVFSIENAMALVTLLVFWVAVSRINAPEPRYAVIASNWLYFTTASVVSGLAASSQRRWVMWAFSALSVALWASAWRPSSFRTEGPAWNPQLEAAQRDCQARGPAAFAYFHLLPLPVAGGAPSEMRISCQRFISEISP